MRVFLISLNVSLEIQSTIPGLEGDRIKQCFKIPSTWPTGEQGKGDAFGRWLRVLAGRGVSNLTSFLITPPFLQTLLASKHSQK